MNLRLTTVATFCTPEDAEVARLVLEDNGIATSQEGANTVGMLWYYGNATGWVKLQVAEADAARAREILSLRLDDENADKPPRRCPKCGVKVPAGYAICWACESPIDEAEEPSSAPPDGSSPPIQDADEDDESEPPTAIGDAMAWRAFAAAIFGVVFCPPLLSFYSGWILLKIAFQNPPLSRKGRRCYYAAMIVDLGVCCAVGWFMRHCI